MSGRAPRTGAGDVGRARWFVPPPSLLLRQDGTEDSAIEPPKGLFAWMMRAGVRRMVMAPLVLASAPAAVLPADSTTTNLSMIDIYEGSGRCARR